MGVSIYDMSGGENKVLPIRRRRRQNVTYIAYKFNEEVDRTGRFLGIQYYKRSDAGSALMDISGSLLI